jgi:hypothetical protein
MIYQREHYCLIGLDFSLCEMPLVQKDKTYEIKNYL